MSVVELLDYKIYLVCIYRSTDGDFHKFLKFHNSYSKDAIKKEKCNFMWRPEHQLYGRQCKIMRIKKLAAIV
jgi:hypothetical protein